MQTKLSYFEDTYRFEAKAVLKISDKDEQGHFLILDHTIFHPQGGGQPSDRGNIRVGNAIIPILKVKKVDNDIRHYTDKDYGHLLGTEALCSIDSEMRLQHARLHTAGHLIANVIEKQYPDLHAVKGHHFPDQCYIEFTSNCELNDISIVKKLRHLKK